MSHPQPDRINDPLDGLRYRRWYGVASRLYDERVRFSDRGTTEQARQFEGLTEATRAALPGVEWCELAQAAVEDVLERRRP
ncbi:MAG: hypothetical protein ACOYD1_13175, partial [Candidatus Nanopelagicales bacterium]